MSSAPSAVLLISGLGGQPVMPLSTSSRTPQASAVRKIEPTFHRLRTLSTRTTKGRRSVSAPRPPGSRSCRPPSSVQTSSGLAVMRTPQAGQYMLRPSHLAGGSKTIPQRSEGHWTAVFIGVVLDYNPRDDLARSTRTS